MGWDRDLTAAALLAVAAAAVFATSAGLQRSAGRDHADLASRGLGGLPALLGRSARRPRWWLGWAANLLGFALQAAALRLASVEIVQPLVALQVVVALAVVAWQRRRPPGTAGLLGAVGVCGGAAMLVILAGRLGVVPASVAVAPARLPAVLAGAGVLVAAVVASSRWVGPGRRGLLLGAAAGVCCASSAVLLDVVVDLAAAPLAGAHALAGLLLGDWRVYALLGSVVASTLVGQAALAAGRLPATLAMLTAVNPAASIALSAAAAGVLPLTPPRLVGAVVAALCMLAGALLVARAGADAEGAARPGITRG